MCISTLSDDPPFYARPIADALKFLHVLGILHRDFALRNILIGADGSPKVGAKH
jgi:serine/threonine protein kinase